MRLLLCLLCFLLLPAWQSDNALTLTYGPTYKQPNIPTNHTNHGADVGMFRVALSHRDDWQYGSNYLVFGVQKSNGHDPERNNPNFGATQFFGGYRGLLSGNALAGRPIFSNAIISDVRLSAGMEFNDKNSALSNKKKQMLAGINVKFNVPGTLVLGLHYSHEWNYNAIVHKSVIFNPSFEMELFAMQPLAFTGLPLRYELNLTLTTPKGKDGFGRQTVNELFTQQRLVLDAGALLWNEPKRFDMFVGFQYWYAKQGGDPTLKSGSVEETAIFGTILHF